MNPCRISSRNVPPGGSIRGFVQYTPLVFGRSWPPYAYSRSRMTTPVCRSEEPRSQRTEESFPGGRRSYTFISISVLLTLVDERCWRVREVCRVLEAARLCEAGRFLEGGRVRDVEDLRLGGFWGGDNDIVKWVRDEDKYKYKRMTVDT